MTRNRWSVVAALALVGALIAGTAVGADQGDARGAGQASTRVESPAPAVDRPDIAARGDWRPIVRLFQPFTLAQGDAVDEVVGVLADVRIEGLVRGDIAVVLGDVGLAETAVVEGSIVVVGGSARVRAGARVDGDVVIIGGMLDGPPEFVPRGEHVVIGAPVIHESLRAIAPWIMRGPLLGRLIVPDIGWVWTVVAIVFLFGLFVNHVLARQVGAVADTLAERPVGAFFVGLLVIVLAGPAMAVVAITVIGLPFLIAAMIAAAVIGRIAVARALGRTVMAEVDAASRAQAMRSFAIGSVVLILAYMVPVVGLVTFALAGVFALGSVTMTFVSSLRRERPAAAPPPVAPSSPGAPLPDVLATAPAAGAPCVATADTSASVPAKDSSVGSGVLPGGADAPSPAFAAMPAPPAATAGLPAGTASAPGDLLVHPRASFLDRLVAFALDAILVGIIHNVLDMATRDGGPYLALLFAYHVIFWAWKGTTLGGIVVGVRMARTTGEDPRFIDALVRALSAIFSVAALGIGCFWMITDAQRQMWHDKIAGTVVLKLPRELVLR